MHIVLFIALFIAQMLSSIFPTTLLDHTYIRTARRQHNTPAPSAIGRHKTLGDASLLLRRFCGLVRRRRNVRHRKRIY